MLERRINEIIQNAIDIYKEVIERIEKDADVLIYNSTIEGKIETTEQLLSKCPMLADFKAVQNGNVWCTTQSLFQESMELPDLILDMNRVFTAESPNAVNEDELKFLTHVS